MPIWFIDPPMLAYLSLATLVIVLGAMWYHTSSHWNLIQFAVVTVIVLGYVLISMLLDSPREEAVRRVRAIAAASVKRDYDELFSHVSKDFRYKNFVDVTTLRSVAQTTPEEWEGLGVSDFDRNEVTYVDDKTIRIGFLATASGLGVVYWCIATFQKEDDGAYRLKTFLLYNALQKEKSAAEAVPGLG